MNVHIDTSLLVYAMSSVKRRALLDEASERGDRLHISTIVLYEFLRGSRTAVELSLTEAFFPRPEMVSFGPDEARAAAQIYRDVPRARARVSDIAIAGCAIEHNAALWTLNTKDFRDIPGLTLYR